MAVEANAVLVRLVPLEIAAEICWPLVSTAILSTPRPAPPPAPAAIPMVATSAPAVKAAVTPTHNLSRTRLSTLPHLVLIIEADTS